MPEHPKQYKFDIAFIFRRAFELSKINNWILVQGLVLIVLLTLVVFSMFIAIYDGGESLSSISNNTDLGSAQIMPSSYQAMFELLITVLLAPLWTGVAMNAVASNRNESASFIKILSYYRYLPILAVAALIVSFITTLGFLLYIIPGLYLFTATTFTMPLIADKGYNPIKAIIESIKVVNSNLTKMLSLYLIFLGMFFLVIASFGFAYLWVGPFYFNVKAVLYQDLFCEEKSDDINDNSQNDTGVFNA